MPGGRPTECKPEITEEICHRLCEGESLRSICSDEHMPAKSSVLLWVVQDREGFAERYIEAREAAGYSHADEMLDLRHQVLEGELDPHAAKVVADMLKWAAERMAPKKHSLRHEHTGREGGPLELKVVYDDGPDEDEAGD